MKSSMVIRINGHNFEATESKGVWTFTCSFPEVAEDWIRARGIWDAVERFTTLALNSGQKREGGGRA